MTDRIKLAAALTEHDLDALLADWQIIARNDQLPPVAAPNEQAWRVWLILGGRGVGKTRAGSEWLRGKVFGEWPGQQARRIALIGETIADVRNVMIEGTSGLLAVHGDDERPLFEPSKMRLSWQNGAVAQMFSAENPEGLRGPQFDTAWCDEVGKWKDPDAAWDMMQFGLRLGDHPQVVVTTTPRTIDLLKRLLDDPATAISRSATADNAANLAPTFMSEIERRYASSVLGRQELLGELVDDQTGTLWQRNWIEDQRVGNTPELTRLVVADIFEPLPMNAKFRSFGINYLLHCLPGRMAEKAPIVFDNLLNVAADGASFFGATILQGDAPRSPAAQSLMNFYNRKGIFSNDGDTLQDLDRALIDRFQNVQIKQLGSVAVFEAHTG